MSYHILLIIWFLLRITIQIHSWNSRVETHELNSIYIYTCRFVEKTHQKKQACSKNNQHRPNIF